MNIRKLALSILDQVLLEKGFLSDLLLDIKSKVKEPDFRLLWTLCYGTLQRWFYLEQIAKNSVKTLKLKRKEKICTYMSLYQCIFLTRMPKYAIFNEQIALAKSLSAHFAKFLDYLLHHFEPIDQRIFHPALEKTLQKQLGKKTKEEIVEAFYQEPKLFFREVGTKNMHPFTSKKLMPIAKDPTKYIQNPTPMNLFCALMDSPFKSILDLSASPGGKTLLCRDFLHPKRLVSNDISEKKIKRLKENIKKYKIDCTTTEHLGQNYPLDPFDLVIVDAPCSNTGVLNKKPEALFRYTKKHILELTKLQLQLLDRAAKITTHSILYMTCSILQEENEALIRRFLKTHRFKIKKMERILPDTQGNDGGFACALEKTT
ncbi:MAG: Ribosomal RNA small subunit methyltransferase B [Chlamydiae bacterium]|nr:Ribosomal RNA small subunit methyltransferase B [Chlamydiota bacterium]